MGGCDPIADAAHRWALRDMVEAGQTDSARFWTCVTAGGRNALLKMPHAGNLAGHSLLAAYQGRQAAQVFHYDAHSIVMERVTGPRLISVFETGRHSKAAAVQIAVTQALLAQDVGGAGLPRVDDLVAPALSVIAPDWAKPIVVAAQDRIQDRLTAPYETRALHGDLHPRNILLRGADWVAIDAEGVLGPPAFDFANLFLNPWDHPDVVLASDRMDRIAADVAQICGTTKDEVLVWAMANALFYAHLQFANGHGRHPVRCLARLLRMVDQ